MFDFAQPLPDRHPQPAAVLFLSNPFGVTREWRGLSDCLGTRAICRAFDRGEDMSAQAATVAGGVHIVAHGTGAFHALHLALNHPGMVRSLTLIDPDLIEALPDLPADLVFRGQRRMIARATAMDRAGRRIEAAALVIDWWMGRHAWARTAARLRARFTGAVHELVLEWQRQAAAPLALDDLATLSCPVRIVIGQRARLGTRALARRLTLALPHASLTKPAEARGAAHLTMPHIVDPDIANFVVSSDMPWQCNAMPVAG